MRYGHILFLSFAWLACLQAAEEKAILDVVPSLSELGPAWSTNLVTYLLDLRSQPAEIDHRREPRSSRFLENMRSTMKQDGCTGFGSVVYSHRDVVVNHGRYGVTIQRWSNRRSLQNRWVAGKMTPNRILRSRAAPVGEDRYWSRDCLFQEFSFRRELFSVTIEAPSASDYQPMVRLAEAIDATRSRSGRHCCYCWFEPTACAVMGVKPIDRDSPWRPLKPRNPFKSGSWTLSRA